MFGDSSESEMDIEERKTRPKKPNLVEIREKLLKKRTEARFTDYDGVMFDSTLSLVQNINNFKKRSAT